MEVAAALATGRAHLRNLCPRPAPLRPNSEYQTAKRLPQTACGRMAAEMLQEGEWRGGMAVESGPARLHVRQRLDDGALVGSGAIDVTPEVRPRQGPAVQREAPDARICLSEGLHPTRSDASRSRPDHCAANQSPRTQQAPRGKINLAAVAFYACICIWTTCASLMTEREGNASLVLISR